MLYPIHPLLSLGVSFGPPLQEYLSPQEVHSPRAKGDATSSLETTRPLMLFAAQWSAGPFAPASHHTLIRAV